MTYLGRIIALGETKKGELVGIYRVSSRSFTNREAVINKSLASIRLKEEIKKGVNINPYISYNCLEILQSKLVISNGIHTNFISQKILNSFSPKDSLIQILSSMDYEYDDLKTPRIAGVLCLDSKTLTLGVVRPDGLEVKVFPTKKGSIFYISTYEHNYLSSYFSFQNFQVKSASEACDYILNQEPFKQFSNPITTVAAFQVKNSFELATLNKQT